MGRYVDGFVLAVPNEKLDAYREIAAEAGKLWIEHGALEYVEAVGDDVEPDTEGMPMRTFPELAEAGDDDTVVFSFIVFESREHRDEVNAKVMEDPEMSPERFEEGGEMPFDGARMAYGGFRSIVDYEG
ncbi:DUF1428 domain-containing protein [Halogeometricum luteum]|uniref:DUF1428 domain-containing protein n=1 Tax=Halogeometricum luteum TaxID=2950537 RepID=A0ABU2FZJ9_9EURY|nr:DUF1428 domain-containing protein [Halogeometricum sp. S3BR5-2]MDS0293965.1 DUF1428 domain-containing protein [Halogeometricum sp. S3BR5-2]